MRRGLKGLTAGLGTVLTVSAVGLADASACSRHADGHRYDAPPAAYRYAPPAYRYGPPPAVYAPPFRPGYYGAGRETPYGYRPVEGCACDDDGYAPSHAPPAAYDDWYRPAGVWVPVRWPVR